MIARSLATLCTALLVVACAPPAAVAPPTPSPAATTATPPPAGSAAPGAVAFVVEPGGSKAVVRVRETLAGRSAPNDAVLESEEVSGSFGLRPDGTFSDGSKISVGLGTLRSDSGLRDNVVKGQVLQVSRFATADFVPQRATGLPSPLPASGEWTFTVAGKMTIRGTERDVTFDVTAKRDGTGLNASARNAPSWTFGDFGLEVPRVASVISIVDEIRLEVTLVARAT